MPCGWPVECFTVVEELLNVRVNAWIDVSSLIALCQTWKLVAFSVQPMV
jgi:hypothetical protein